MALSVLRENFVHKLQGSISQNLQRYQDDEPWLDDIASTHSFSTNLEPAAPLELLDPKGDDRKDLENAKRLHKALPNLSLVQARDPRLWTRLAHVELWSYMRKRWDAGKHSSKPAKQETYIRTHYFVAQNASRALVRNGIARLWWYAKVTYDPNRNNPYELTQVLLQMLDITQQILERSYGRAPTVAVGFLEFLLQHKKTLLGAGNENRRRIRHLAKHLNLRGGYSLLDCLTKNDVIAVLEDEYTAIEKNPGLVELG
jgi:hypothetical protein